MQGTQIGPCSSKQCDRGAKKVALQLGVGEQVRQEGRFLARLQLGVGPTRNEQHHRFEIAMSGHLPEGGLASAWIEHVGVVAMSEEIAEEALVHAHEDEFMKELVILRDGMGEQEGHPAGFVLRSECDGRMCHMGTCIHKARNTLNWGIEEEEEEQLLNKV